MNFLKKIFLLLVLSLLTEQTFVLAEETYRRKVSLEWEETEDAKYYEVEITSNIANSKPMNFVSDHAGWNGNLVPGDYKLRVRALDKRKVPGEWSDQIDFNVFLDPVIVISPKPNEKIISNDDEKQSVTFKWKEAPGAQSYDITVMTADGQVIETKNTTDTDFDLKLPVAKAYTWKIIAKNKRNLASEPVANPFFVYGQQLDKPKFKEPKNEFVREVEWSRPNYTDTFDYQILRQDPKSKNWKLVESIKNEKEILKPFSQKYPGGQYKIRIRGNSQYRVSSKITEEEFPVRNGDRSPASEEIATIRESIDYSKGWFFVASYLISFVNFENEEVKFENAVSGTGRLGMGYLSPKSKWGFLGILDAGGISIAGSIRNYYSLETNGIYRVKTGDRSEIRSIFGLYYRTQLLLLDKNANSSNGISDVSPDPSFPTFIGLHLGAEYWQAISKKLGFQFNLHLYPELSSTNYPQGAISKNDFSNASYQIGFLGSYRLSEKTTGLAGIAQRSDKIKAGNNQGTLNQTQNGTYINFYLERSL